MSQIDPLDTYRRMFAEPHDGVTAWWYLGSSFAEMDGYPVIPVLHVETVMLYKTTTLDADSFRMDWWEIGYMRDPVTGEVAETWTNPITGARIPFPQKFEEGPSYFTFARGAGGEGLKVELVQKHARVESVEVQFSERDGRILLDQHERKVRGFPLPDGTMPSLDSDQVSRARTRLSIFSAKADLERPGAPSSGSYEFELKAPAWMGMGERPGRTIVRGVMVKAPDPQAQLNPTGWARLRELFPDCFEGERIVPNWG
jgi:hypothetical protein